MIFKNILESFWALLKHVLSGLYEQWYQVKILKWMGRLSTKFQKVGNFGLMDIFSYPSLNFACLVCSFILCSAYTKIDLLKTHIHLMMDFESTNIWCEKWNLIRFDKEMNKIVIDIHYYHNFTWLHPLYVRLRN